MISEFQFASPFNLITDVRFHDYDDFPVWDIDCFTSPYTGVYELVIRLFYTEELNGVFTATYTDWKQNTVYIDNETETFCFPIKKKNFYIYMGNNIETNEEIIRDSYGLGFYFTLGDEELANYILINRSSSGILQEKPIYTNIKNGIGIFTSRYKHIDIDKHLQAESIDMLAQRLGPDISGSETANLAFIIKKGLPFFVIS